MTDNKNRIITGFKMDEVKKKNDISKSYYQNQPSDIFKMLVCSIHKPGCYFEPQLILYEQREQFFYIN